MKKILISILALCLVIGVIGASALTTEMIPNLTRLFATETEEETGMRVFAEDAASISSDKDTVQPGETFDVSVTLETGTLGWEITFNNENSEGLITNEEIIPTVTGNGLGQNGEIYFIQVMPPFTTYEAGTVIATKQYTVSETATIGSTITIDVTGMIADAGWDIHEISGSVTVSVGETSSTADVVIKYVDVEDNTTVLKKITEQNIEIGTEYEYTVPETFTDENDGEWILVDETNLERIHTVIKGTNEILVEYEKVVSDVVIRYVEKDNHENIINTMTAQNVQVGTEYKYTVQKTHTNNGEWILVGAPGDRTHTVVIGANEILIEYEKALTDLVIKYVDAKDHTNILEEITEEDIQIGTEYDYTVPEDLIVSGLLWRTETFGDGIYTVQEEDNEILIEYEKVLVDVVIKYVDVDDNKYVLETITEEDIQVGTEYEYTVPATYMEGDDEWLLVDDTNLNRTHTVTESTNEILVEYVSLLERAEVVIKYVEKDNHDNVLNLIDEGRKQIGKEYTYTVPGKYTKDGLWSVIGASLERTYTVLEEGNIIIVEYEKVLADIVIKYVEKNNNTNILNTVTKEDIQVGTTYTYTVEENYTKNGEWILSDITNLERTYTVLEEDNEVLVEYDKKMSAENVVVKYVEKDNHDNVLNSIDEGKKQIGTEYTYTLPTTYTKDGVWVIVDSTNLNRTHIVNEEDNEIVIEYDKKMSTTNIVIKYVEKDNHDNVIDTIDKGIRQVGTTIEYIVPRRIVDENDKKWALEDETNLGRTHIVTESNNEILVEYIETETEEADVVIKYVEKDNHDNILNVITEQNVEIGIEYAYTVPAKYIDANDDEWILVDKTNLNRTHIVVEGDNEIFVEYVKSEEDEKTQVIIKYVEKGNNTNVLNTITVGELEIGTTYEYIVPETYTKNGKWILSDIANLERTHTVTEGTNAILVEYEKVLADVVIKYVEKEDYENVLKTIEVGEKQVGITYEYTVPETFTKDEEWYVIFEEKLERTHTITEGTNEIIVEYVKVKEVELKATVTYELKYATGTSNVILVTAKITANKPIKTPTGWTKVSDTVFTKDYTKNTAETLMIEDLEGNKTTVSIDVTQITAKTKKELEDNGIIIQGLGDTEFDDGYKLKATKKTLTQTEKDLYNTKINNIANGNKLLDTFDLTIEKNGENESRFPDGIKIKIPKANYSNYKNFKLIYVDSLGVFTAMNTTIEGDYIVATTTHLSEYALTGSEIGNNNNTNNSNTNNNNSSNNTNSNVVYNQTSDGTKYYDDYYGTKTVDNPKTGDINIIAIVITSLIAGAVITICIKVLKYKKDA